MKKAESAMQNSSMKKLENEGLLNKLLFTGRTTKKVMIADLEFEIQTLTEKDSRDIFGVLLSFSDEKRLPIIKGVTLAKSVVSINGVSFDDLAKESLMKDQKEITELSVSSKKNEIILMMQTTLTSKLFEAYEELNKQAQDSISVEKLKN